MPYPTPPNPATATNAQIKTYISDYLEAIFECEQVGDGVGPALVAMQATVAAYDTADPVGELLGAVVAAAAAAAESTQANSAILSRLLYGLGSELLEGVGEVASVAILPLTLALTHPDSDTLAVTALNAAGRDVTAAFTPAWASDDTDVATVDADGLVTSVGAGTANISCTMGGVESTAPCVVTVT